MKLAQSYARSLFDLSSENPEKGGEYLKNLSEALKRRGHEKLLPQIFSAYKTLELQKERTKIHNTTTPEQERTRNLLELYRKLTQSAHE